MSKKTENIRKIISNLEVLQNRLEEISKQSESRELDNIQFEMNQNLKNLKFWIESLYLYNGKSTSRAKQNSSRENGKKGGRPPKDISLAKKRILEIENKLLPEIEYQLKREDFSADELALNKQLEAYQNEMEQLYTKLTSWEHSKRKTE